MVGGGGSSGPVSSLPPGGRGLCRPCFPDTRTSAEKKQKNVARQATKNQTKSNHTCSNSPKTDIHQNLRRT